MGPGGRRISGGEGSTMRNFVVCRSANIARVIKSRILIWVGHVILRSSGFD